MNEKKERNRPVKISESKYDEVLSFIVPSFYDFNFPVEEFCSYEEETGNICPLILADRDQTRKHAHIPNFDIQNCMWVCRYFKRIDIPFFAKRVERSPPK